MFDLRGFRKDRKLSQKQISEVIGIGTSFISQIETGKDPMPGYIPEKLAAEYGKEEVEAYFREPTYDEVERHLRKKYRLPAGAFSSMRGYGEPPRGFGEGYSADPAAAPIPLEGANMELFERILTAIERRDELAIQQQREFEKQGARIDDLFAMLKGRAQ